MLSTQELSIPVLHWLAKRAHYVKNDGSLGWVVNDRYTQHLTPALWLCARQGLVELPEHILQQVYQVYLMNHARWMVKEYALRKILDALCQAGIAVIPLKGVILQSQLYQDSGLRPMGDIDILVMPEAYIHAAGILHESGLWLNPENGFESLTCLEDWPESYWPGELIFQDRRGMIVELHQHLVTTPWFIPAYPVDIGAVWARSIPLSEDDNSFGCASEQLWKVSLSPYDMLAHLCLHLAMHGLLSLQGFLDVDLWIRKLPHDWQWDQFIDLVKSWKICSATYHVLSYCRFFMDTPLPDGLLTRLDPGFAARSRVRILITAESLISGQPTLGKRFPTLVKLALVDSISTIMNTLFRLTFPDSALLKQKYGQDKLLPASNWKHICHIWYDIKRGD